MAIKTLFDELEDLGLELGQLKVLPSDLKEKVLREKKTGTSLTLGVRKTSTPTKDYWYFRAIYRVPDEKFPVKLNLVRLTEEQKDNDIFKKRLEELYQLKTPQNLLPVLQEFHPKIADLAEEIDIPQTEIIRILLTEGLDKELIQNLPFFKELVMTFLNAYKKTESPVLRDIIFRAQTVIRQRTG